MVHHATLPHRVRRLRCQARAPDTATALAVQRRLRAHSEPLGQALAQALDALDPGDGRLLWLECLELRLTEALLAGPREALVVALQQQIAQQWPADAGAPPRSGHGGPSTPPAPPQAPASPEDERSWLLAYLAEGRLPWPLAGLGAERVQAALGRAAQALAEGDAVWRLAGQVRPLAQRVGWWRRWWQLWPASERVAWWRQQRLRRAAASVQGQQAQSALESWLQARPEGPAEPPGQALWLALVTPAAWPLDAAARAAEWSDYRALVVAELGGLPEGFDGDDAPDGASASTATPAPPRVAEPPPLYPLPATAMPLAWARPQALHAEPGWMVPAAGLVLLHPWLPALLQACGIALPAPGEAAAGPALARAAGLLHWLALADADEPAEWTLPVVKLLLGQAPERPWALALQAPDAGTRAEGQALLSAVVAHWGALGGTGPEALRSSFLQRQGLLARRHDHWLLRPEHEAFDLLLDRLPWSLGWIRLPWMAEPLCVEWSAAG